MNALLISLLSSLSVGVFIKSLKINSTKSLFLMVFFNYITALILSYSLFDLQIHTLFDYPESIIIILILGFLMPSIFYFLNKSLKTSGLAKTDVFQRLSLIIPVVLSFKLFNETFTYSKLVVILLSFASILLLLYKKSTNNGNFNIFYLLAVFLGYGIVDTLFKIIAINQNLNYVLVLFGVFICAALISMLYLFVLKGKLNYTYILYGVILGILNFSNIFFYLKAHKIYSDSPTLVFITMNLGVILGGVLIGKLYFKEQITKNVLLGIFCALLSIILLALIQLKIL